MKKPPIRADEKVPPYRPKISETSYDRTFFDQFGTMWIFPRWRIRTYICSLGVEHKTYWRTHWQQGRQDWVACEHEVTQ